jgi:hypothetical protein
MRQYDDLLIDALLDHGFTVQEAESLITLQERVERERQEEERRRGSGQRRGSAGATDQRDGDD